MRNAMLMTAGLVVALAVYVLHLQSQLSILKLENEALRKQKGDLESLLAERDEQKAMQRKLDEQLKQLVDAQINRQSDQLHQLREQHRKDLAAAQREKERLLRELQIAQVNTPVPVLTPAEISSVPGSTAVWVAPAGSPPPTTNVALGKTVTASVERPYNGTFAQITDGVVQSSPVTLRRGTQWVQIDLQASYPLYTIKIWHDSSRQTFRDVIVQASDDPLFRTNVLTLFNNDADNSSGLGMGRDKEYVETQEGKRLQFPKGFTARYVRCYSRGGTIQVYNCYQEIEVHAFVQPLEIASGGDN